MSSKIHIVEILTAAFALLTFLFGCKKSESRILDLLSDCDSSLEAEEITALYEEGVDAGYPKVISAYARALREGRRVEPNLKKSLELAKRAGMLGETNAMLMVVANYRSRLEVERGIDVFHSKVGALSGLAKDEDILSLLFWEDLAANHGVLSAMYAVADILSACSPQDVRIVTQLSRAFNIDGRGETAFRIARAYGLVHDESNIGKWLKVATQAGIESAKIELAFWYARGCSEQAGFVKARKLFDECKNANAEDCIHFAKINFRNDPNKAIEYLLTAKERMGYWLDREAEAERIVAYCDILGKYLFNGLVQNYERGLPYFESRWIDSIDEAYVLGVVYALHQQLVAARECFKVVNTKKKYGTDPRWPDSEEWSEVVNQCIQNGRRPFVIPKGIDRKATADPSAPLADIQSAVGRMVLDAYDVAVAEEKKAQREREERRRKEAEAAAQKEAEQKRWEAEHPEEVAAMKKRQLEALEKARIEKLEAEKRAAEEEARAKQREEDDRRNYLIDVAKGRMAEYENMISVYRLKFNTKDAPESLFDLECIKFLENKDPWARPYYYKAVGKSYTIISAGPNGMYGDDDDIKVVHEEK